MNEEELAGQQLRNAAAEEEKRTRERLVKEAERRMKLAEDAF